MVDVKRSFVILAIAILAAPLLACTPDECENKADGTLCEDYNFCFCYQGRSTAADPVLCHEYPCSESCVGKNVTESCGDGMICDPGGSCVVPKDYKP